MHQPLESATPYTWMAHPARQNPGRAAMGGALILAITGAAGFSFGPWWAALSAIVLTLSLNRFFFPSRFVIDDRAITARYPLRSVSMRWVDVRRFVVDVNGGYLSTRTRRSWLDAYRGMHLVFGDDRERAIAMIRAHVHCAANLEPDARPAAESLPAGDRAWAG